jgi:hypothetical protein
MNLQKIIKERSKGLYNAHTWQGAYEQLRLFYATVEDAEAL